MRVLFVHCFYQQSGGEDSVFRQETSLLRPDVDTELLTSSNKSGIGGAIQFFSSLWNFRAAARLKSLIFSFKPEVIHIHNLHFAFGPIIIWVAKKAGAKIVVTLHNFRLLCPSAILMADGKLFIDSIKRSFPWEAVKRGVYRDSVLLTFWLAFINWFHRRLGTWHMVDKYIVLTEASKRIFIESTINIPESKFLIKPNFVFPASVKNDKRAGHFLFIGRLTEEKGVRTLVQAFQHTGHKLLIAGDGPLKGEVLEACKDSANIEYLGNLQREDVQLQMLQCTALIFPSIWYEGMPMTIIEAFSTGTPVLASNIGAMSSMIQHNVNGLHFTPSDTKNLVDTIERWASMEDGQKLAFQRNAFNSYERHYTPNANKQYQLDIYKALTDK